MRILFLPLGHRLLVHRGRLIGTDEEEVRGGVRQRAEAVVVIPAGRVPYRHGDRGAPDDKRLGVVV